MIWKAIGQSATGLSHAVVNKGCDDAIQFRITTSADGNELLICCASDGAGSAQYAAWASNYTTLAIADHIAAACKDDKEINEVFVYSLVEEVYEGIKNEAQQRSVELNEFSCTLLGCCVAQDFAVFFQIGDGAIVRNDGLGFYTPVWWPQNGEYQNSTSFLVDDPCFKNLRITIIDEPIDEVAVFTDGLQMLALKMEEGNVHQPFFQDLFKVLRMAGNENEVAILDRKLGEFLNSTAINARTDDDKTLFLASRLS